MSQPLIIQGGMGVAVSNWRLARSVAQLGQLGVISGTLLAVVFARRLQAGDPEGHMADAMVHFPLPTIAERVRANYFVAGGKPAGAPFKAVAMPGVNLSQSLNELTVLANFAEIHLAKQGHSNPVGINLLEKIQVATLASLYGAMLAGVDYVLMGAGIPREIPGVLDRFAAGEAAEIGIDVLGAAAGTKTIARFDPSVLFNGPAPKLRRPQFLAIVSSATLAITLAKKSTGRVDGFIVEGDVAGGHNAPPRGQLQLSAIGEPVYGPRDIPDLPKIASIGLPFWLAGAYADPAKIAEARALGATGVQIGTAFAFCEESAVRPDLKRQVCRLALAGKAGVYTDPLASPTGFPFKVLQVEGSLSAENVYGARPRVCDLGYLRDPYARADGSVGYRCAAEPAEDYVRKLGEAPALAGRKCLCNGLLATAGLGQSRADGTVEPPILTAGNDVALLARFIPAGAESYTAADVIRFLLGEIPQATA
jgi:NAD(P)H-dependent flavin oxidoreductase YrpB (nitropropane dioxygenase family)